MTAIVQKKRRHSATPGPGREFRLFSAGGLEVRNDSDSDAIVITGMPIVYNQPYTVRDLFGEFEETMLPGVADSVLAAGADVRFLINHDGLPLARTLSGTLTLDGSSTRGLPMTASLDARSQMATDLAVAIERGDVSQMSCGFVVARDDWPDNDHRSISQFAQLFDVSAVTYPASPTTSIELAQRSLAQQPVDSQARIRRLWIGVGADLREGRSLSEDNVKKLQTALESIQAAEGEQPEEAVPAQEPDNGAVAERAARRAADMSPRADDSYNDREQALSDALAAKYASSDSDDDLTCDLWLVDASDTWVVFRVWGDLAPGAGLWRLTYTVDGDSIVLDDMPTAVTVETSYVPTERSTDHKVEERDDDHDAERRAAAELDMLRLRAQQLRLRRSRVA